ncbi:glycosyltransferase family 4 protein [Lysobacter arvi]|uniref:Glycosyltransferase family 4 protein n=1 Tax=Lysobacter arvi TaxID=3038776 RepID=A0ABU1C902_9GAMM|nr:glycosyltransferase family 4 protein [Lysobacter arvi]MDR0181663.1 glycosyltransferase family 4 protein [Lysobacter arvi]
MVTRSLPFHRTGGMEAVAWDLARAFVRRGARVEVLTTSSENLPARSNIDGVEVRTLPAPSGRYSMKWWWLSRCVYFKEYVDTVDVVFSVSAGALGFAGGRHSRRSTFVAQMHGTAWGEFVSKMRQRSLWACLKSLRNIAWMFRDLRYRYFDAFVAVGPAVSNDMLSFPTRAIMGPAPALTISNGIDSERFAFDQDARQRIRHLLGIDEKSRVLISASRLHPQKGILEGLRAFAGAADGDPMLRYIVVGDGPDARRLKEAADALGVTSKVYFIGRIERDLLAEYLSAADVFLFSTTRVEGLPMNVLEAIAAGLPVIVSAHVADPRFESVVVDPKDHLAMVKAIETTRPATNRASKLSEEFTLYYSADAYLSLFAELQSRRTSAAGDAV